MLRFLRIGICWILTLFARLALFLHRPVIVAITGSVGKTTTKDMIAVMLQESGHSVRSSRKSYNSAFGVPLAILGLPSGVRNPFLWLWVLFAAPFRSLFGVPKYVVLEVGLEFPGDISDILRWLKPDVGVLTHLPQHPVHLEYFSDRDSLYREKVSLLAGVKSGGVALYNGGDAVQKKYLSMIPDGVSVRSFNSDSISVSQSGIHCDDGGNPIGTDVVLSFDGVDEPFYIPETLGVGVVQSLVVAVATVRAIDPAVSVSVLRKAIASRAPTPGRMRILSGKNGSVILDDTYNASPVSLGAALDTLSLLQKRKKVVVLGVMAQLGDVSEEVHRSLGEKASGVADHVFVVGDAPYMEGAGVRFVKDADEAIASCLSLADADTVFLCKGSQVSRLERVVAGLLSESVSASAVLVRQEAYWSS